MEVALYWLADTASSQSDIKLSKLTREPYSFKNFKKKKSTNSIKFPSASCKFWLHWSLSPYKLKYAEDFAEFLKHYRKPIPQSSTNLKPITCQKGGLNGSLKSYPGFLQRMKAALHLYPNANRSVHKLS